MPGPEYVNRAAIAKRGGKMHKEGGPMNSPNAILKPAGDDLPGKPESSAARTSFLWVVIGLALVVIPAFYFLRRLNRLELQVAALGKQVEQTNQTYGRLRKNQTWRSARPHKRRRMPSRQPN